jgi:hypothetical protein
MVDKVQYQYPVGVVFTDCVPVAMQTKHNDNITVCVRNRLIQDVPEPDEELWKDVDVLLDGVLPRKNVHKIPVLQWVMAFPAKARSRLLDAWDSLGSVSLRPSDFYRKMFLKSEFLPRLARWADEIFVEVDPRPISAICDRAKAALGPWMKSFSHHLAKIWSFGSRKCHHRRCVQDGEIFRSRIVYAAGMTPELIGSWYKFWTTYLGQFGEVRAFMDDFSRFDSTVQACALRSERRQYKRFGARGRVMQTLKAQADTRGFVMCSTDEIAGEYVVDGTRKSGDTNTSCGNAILNVGAHLLAFERARVDEFALIVMGDDALALVVTDNDTLPDIARQTALQLGFKAKPKLAPVEDAEFCSHLFWPVDGDRFVLGPKVGRHLSKGGWSLSPVSNISQHMRGVMLGLHSEYSYLEPLVTIRDYVLDVTREVKAGPVVPAHKFRATVDHTCDERTEDRFFERYGVSMSDVRSWAAGTVNGSALPVFCELGPLTGAFEVDL